METFIENVKAELLKQNKTKAELARYLEVTPQRLNNWFLRKNIPTDYAIRIAKFLNTSVENLNNANEEIPLTHYLPIIGSASCGVPTNHFYGEDVEMFPVPSELYREGRYLVRAEGDSMLPKIKDGDLVLCDKDAQVDNGNIIHYTINGENSGIKKAIFDENGKLTMLMPLNTDYPPIVIKDSDEVRYARCLKVIADLWGEKRENY